MGRSERGRRAADVNTSVEDGGGGGGCVICPLSAPIFLPHSQPQLRELCRMRPFPTLPRKPGGFGSGERTREVDGSRVSTLLPRKTAQSAAPDPVTDQRDVYTSTAEEAEWEL